MDDSTKKAIAQLVENAVPQAGSQAKLAARFKVSDATISNIIKGKWAFISDSMWMRIAGNVGFRGKDWKVAATRNFNAMLGWCKTAQERGISLCVSSDAGVGKTFALTQYAAQNSEVFYIQCDEYWGKKQFLCSLCRSIGIDPSGMTMADVADTIISALRKANKPLVILDEADKLKDAQLMFFIALYNKLDGICGFMLVGAPYLAKAWEEKAKRDRRGFREIYSRVGRKFMQLQRISRKDVEMVCQANGVTDEATLNTIWNGVEMEADLRRVRREVEKLSYIHEAQAA